MTTSGLLQSKWSPKEKLAPFLNSQGIPLKLLFISQGTGPVFPMYDISSEDIS